MGYSDMSREIYGRFRERGNGDMSRGSYKLHIGRGYNMDIEFNNRGVTFIIYGICDGGVM